MNAEGTFVLGVGACGALGLEARQLVLASRAGWTVRRRRDLGESRGSVGVSFCSAVPAELEGADRCLALARAALAEALADARTAGLEPSLLERPVILCLALPEVRLDDDARFGRPFLDALADGIPGGIDVRRCEVVRAGNAGFVAVMQRARSRVEEAGGTPALVVVGGVDSFGHTALLADLDTRRRILSRRAVDGFVPGEAAAFAVLGNAAALRSGSARMRVGAAHVGEQPDDDDLAATPAQTLTQVVRAVAEVAPGGRFDWVITDLSPERHRYKEWSFVELRQRARLPRNGMDVVRLGELHGELGAASGAVALAHAAMGFRTGFAPARSALVALSSEGALRGAFSIAAMD